MSKIITTAEVRRHNHKDSVWMIIHNDVYDVTNFLEEHPGGEETLLEAAGKESTQEFEDVGHSEDARELMKKYKIGTLPVEEHDIKAPEPAVATWSKRSSKTRVRIDPKPSNHVENVVVPVNKSGSNLKWYILALLGAIVLGVVIKKKLSA